MKRRCFAILFISCVLLLSGGLLKKYNEAKNELPEYPKDEISQSSSICFENKNDVLEEPLYVTNYHNVFILNVNFTSVTFIPTKETFNDEIVFNVTFDPINEYNRDNKNILVLVGRKSISINGIKYVFENQDGYSKWLNYLDYLYNQFKKESNLQE